MSDACFREKSGQEARSGVGGLEKRRAPIRRGVQRSWTIAQNCQGRKPVLVFHGAESLHAFRRIVTGQPWMIAQTCTRARGGLPLE
jgi:hypothetical protein